MNITLTALSTLYLYNTPMISPSSHSIKPFFTFNNLNMHNFFTNFILDSSISSNTNMFNSNFKNFLNSPIAIRGDQYRLVKRTTFDNNPRYFDDSNLEIIGCNFVNCIHNTTYDGNTKTPKGGAVEYKKTDGNIILYSSTFDKCSASKGDGGAVFVCGEEKDTGETPTHGFTSSFNSSYCCYSRCSACSDINENNAGYGPVMFIFARKIDVFYSSSVNCPSDGKSRGAQFDLCSEETKSSYINASSSSSIYCSGMEYRNSSKGFFTFQTFVNLNGGFMSSFSNLKEGQNITMSYCNFVDNTISNISVYEQDSSIIYVRRCSVFLNNFCFLRIKVENPSKFKIVHFSGGKENNNEATLSNSIIDKNMGSYLIDITTINVKYYDDADTNKSTNTIKLLDLGNCKGEMEPPPTIFSSLFTPSNIFSLTAEFTKSDHFSSSRSFNPSRPFTDSIKFTPSEMFTSSAKFTGSKKFSASFKFTHSDKFTRSNAFDPSNKFTNSDGFSPSNKFTKTNAFSQSKKFTSSSKFTQSESFSPSNTFKPTKHFKASDYFTPSNSFTPSLKFTPSGQFTSSEKFTSSSNFTPSKKFTQSSSFMPSNVFTSSKSFLPTKIFTKSNTFNPTLNFDVTSKFTPSMTFSPSSQFTPSDPFKSSNNFTFSNKFSQSNSFNATKFFEEDLPVGIKINDNKEGGISNGMKIGIGVTVGAVAVVAAIAAIIILRKRKMKPNDFDDESVEVLENTGSTVVTANPLITMMNNDDPFEDSFTSNASFTRIIQNPSLNRMPSNSSIRSMKSNISLSKLPSAPGLNEPLANESIHHMPSSPSVNHINENPSLHQVSSNFGINDHLAD